MQRIPSLHALRAFEAAGRLGSFARAGKELHLTPSAISHQVKALEQHFARPLFIRANRQVILTPDGERLLAGLSSAFGLIQDVCAELSPRPRAQDLAVHCTPSFAAKWLGPRLPRFIVEQPGINLRLSSSADFPDLMRHDEIDVAIAYGTAPKVRGVVARSLGEEEIAALCSPAFAANHRAIDAKAFDGIVLLESSYSPVRWSDWFAHNGLRYAGKRAGPSFDRGSLVVAAAAQGLGVALETTRFAQAELDAGSLIRFGDGRFSSIEREMHFLCFRARDQSAQKIRRFCDWVLRDVSP